MKKILLIAAFLVVSVAVWAGEPHQAYCEIVGTGNFTGTKVKIEIDFGQKVSWTGQKSQRTLVDEQGKKMEFNSMMDAVNYLAQYGWTLHSTYAITESKGMGGNGSVYHYILTKTVTSDEEVKEGIHLKAE